MTQSSPQRRKKNSSKKSSGGKGLTPDALIIIQKKINDIFQNQHTLQSMIQDVAANSHQQEVRLNNNIVELKGLTSKIQYSQKRLEIQVRMLGAIFVNKGVFESVEEFNGLMEKVVNEELGIDEHGNMNGYLEVNTYNLDEELPNVKASVGV